MNKIKGAVWAKLLGWIIWSVSALALVGGILGLVVMESYAVWNKTLKSVEREQFERINEGYSYYAVKGYLEGGEKTANRYLEGEGIDFCYRIYDEKPQDLNKGYLYSYGFENVETDQTVMWEIPYSDNIGISKDELGIPYGTFWDYRSQGVYYCDKICFDEDNGIFYYHTDSFSGETHGNDYYFPAREIRIVHHNIVKKEYEIPTQELEELPYDDSMEYHIADLAPTEEEYDTSFFSLTYDSEKGSYVLWDDQGNQFLSELNLTEYLGDQDELLFDGVRYIRFGELTKIHSKLYPYTAFPDVSYSYLNANLSLSVGVEGVKGCLYVVSAIPTVTNSYGTGVLTMAGQVLGIGNLSVYERSSTLVHLLYSLKGSIWILVFLSFLLLVGSSVFLVMAAGYRINREELVMTPLDNIPLDVYAAGVSLLGLGIMLLMDEFSYQAGDALYTFLSICVLLCVLIAWMCLSLLLSFAVRVKNGKWWRNTIVYWLITKILIGFFWKWFVRICKGIGNGLKLIWEARTLPTKFILTWAVLTALEFLMIVIGVHESEAFVLLIFEKIAATLVIFSCTLQLKKIKEGTENLVSGDVKYQINTEKMFYDLKQMGENINHIGEGIGVAVEERMKSERFKTELITNVSHDIKTPLTSIINYVDLLQKEDIQNEKANEYLEVLERQSSRLKKLIEDLVEASKASSGALSVTEELIDLNVFLSQAAGEYQEKMEKSQLTLILDQPEAAVEVVADGRHLWRVLDNLMNNVCKYALPGSRVYLSLTQDRQIIMKNISQYELNITSDELMERFVRGDESRHTEGHGLGLAIAKSLMELMGGELELVIDGDLFKVILSL